MEWVKLYIKRSAVDLAAIFGGFRLEMPPVDDNKLASKINGSQWKPWFKENLGALRVSINNLKVDPTNLEIFKRILKHAPEYFVYEGHEFLALYEIESEKRYYPPGSPDSFRR